MNNIQKANNQYKKSINFSLRKKEFCPFRYERQMDCLFARLKKDFFRKKHLNVLESGCGQGRLLHYLQRFDPRQNYFGVDYVRDNVLAARKRFHRDENIKVWPGNFYHLGGKYRRFFDIVISYKTLSWLPEYKQAMAEMMRVAKRRIYVTSLFYDGDISFDIKVNHLDKKCFNYLNVYSTNEFKKFCLKRGARRVDFISMNLDVDLPKPKKSNQIRTYTIRTKNNKNLEITGTVLLNWKLVVVQL